MSNVTVIDTKRGLRPEAAHTSADDAVVAAHLAELQAKAKDRDAHGILELALTNDGFKYDGKFNQMPQSYLPYRPKAMLPVYIAGGPDDADLQTRIARAGYTPFISGQWKTAKEMLAQRERIAAHRTKAGRTESEFPLAVNRFVHVTEDHGEALHAAEQLRYSYRIAHNLRTPHYQIDRHVIQDAPAQGEPDLETIAKNAIIGGWEKCAGQLVEEFRLLRPSHLSCCMQFGGTTHAAISMMAQTDVGGQFIRAMHAARSRATEMGQEFGVG